MTMTNDRNNNQGNFAQNPDRAREAGKKGGEMHGKDKDRSRQDQTRVPTDRNQ
jgi:general stress protein YciG